MSLSRPNKSLSSISPNISLSYANRYTLNTCNNNNKSANNRDGNKQDEIIPKYQLPLYSMNSRAVQQLIRDELQLDGNPTTNLASFVTTFMEPEACELMTESLNKNQADQEE